MSRESKQFTYTKEGKDVYLCYFLVPGDIYENKDNRDEWLDIALTVPKLPKKN